MPRTATAVPRDSAGRRVFLGTLAGVLLVQIAWMLAVPAYRGSDEFDHVYKAAAVGRGQWTYSGPAEHGRGGLVRVPGDIVRTAEPICSWYPYTGRDNCNAVRTYEDGTVDVATAAGAYNPAYYLVVGLAIRPFDDGSVALYVARAVSALLCALLIAWAFVLTARWATTRWPLVVAGAGLTPVMLYSTAIAAPNGLSYAGAALVAATILAVHRGVGPPREVALPFLLGASSLLCTHTTGVMWLGLIAVVAMFLRSPLGWWKVIRPGLAWWLPVAVAVTVVAGLCVAWVRYANTNALGESSNVGLPSIVDFVRFVLLWCLQAIAAFPVRNEPAPTGAYLLWGLPLLLILTGALLRRRSERRAIMVALVLLVAVPVSLTVLSYAQQGVSWQGRYSLPLWLVVTWLCASALDRQLPVGRSLVLALATLFSVALCWSAIRVAHAETARGIVTPGAHDLLGYVLVGTLLTAGTTLLLGQRADRQPEPSPAPTRRDTAWAS